MAQPGGAIAYRGSGACATGPDAAALYPGRDRVGHSPGVAYESTSGGAVRFQGPGSGGGGGLARPSRTRPTALDHRRGPDLGGRSGLPEAERSGICTRVVDHASAGQTCPDPLWGGGTSAVAQTRARHGFQDPVGSPREAAPNPVLFGTARSPVQTPEGGGVARVPRRGTVACQRTPAGGRG